MEKACEHIVGHMRVEGGCTEGDIRCTLKKGTKTDEVVWPTGYSDQSHLAGMDLALEKNLPLGRRALGTKNVDCWDRPAFEGLAN